MESMTIESLSAEIEQLRAELADVIVDVKNLMRCVLAVDATAGKQPYQRKAQAQKSGKAREEKKKKEIDKLAERSRAVRLAGAYRPSYREVVAGPDYRSPGEIYNAELQAKYAAQLAVEAATTNPPTQDNNQ